MICINCKTRFEQIDLNTNQIKCSHCESVYFVINKIPIMLNKDNDFYNYNRIFKRYVGMKNETS